MIELLCYAVVKLLAMLNARSIFSDVDILNTTPKRLRGSRSPLAFLCHSALEQDQTLPSDNMQYAFCLSKQHEMQRCRIIHRWVQYS